jgi:hypothetical protein
MEAEFCGLAQESQSARCDARCLRLGTFTVPSFCTLSHVWKRNTQLISTQSGIQELQCVMMRRIINPVEMVLTVTI